MLNKITNHKDYKQSVEPISEEVREFMILISELMILEKLTGLPLTSCPPRNLTRKKTKYPIACISEYNREGVDVDNMKNK